MYKNDIHKNPTFRSQFHEMCAKVGVDPLASPLIRVFGLSYWGLATFITNLWKSIPILVPSIYITNSFCHGCWRRTQWGGAGSSFSPGQAGGAAETRCCCVNGGRGLC